MVCQSVKDAHHTFETLAGLEFQLEEKEDREVELTSIRLNSDHTVTVGETDGPSMIKCAGTWSILETASEEDRPFRMTLDRSYEGGHRRKPTDVGEFEYHVVREFYGNVGTVGDSFAVQGIIHGHDDISNVNVEVGYFSLIDATSDLRP